MSLKMEQFAFALPIKDSSAKFLLLAMCHLSKHGDVWATTERMEAMTGLKARTIREKKTVLISEKWIVKTGQNSFRLSFAQTADSAAQTADSAAQTADSAAQTADSATQAADSATQAADSAAQTADSATLIIENGINGINGIENGESFSPEIFSGLISRADVLARAEMVGIAPEWAGERYDAAVAKGDFWVGGDMDKPLRPSGRIVEQFIRIILPWWIKDGQAGFLNEKKSKNRGGLAAMPTGTINSQLYRLEAELKTHPGNPDDVTSERGSPERSAYWELVERQQKLQAELTRREVS